MHRYFQFVLSAILLMFIAGTSVPFFQEAYAAPTKNALHHVPAEACKQCHEEIYDQWKTSMHANSSALKDPIHSAFYQMTVGDPTKEDVTAHNKFPVCLKCHAPVAALEKTTKLDAAPAYKDGVGCVTCHTFSGFRGTTDSAGKPQYGVDAHIVDQNFLHGASGKTYTTDRVEENAKWPAKVSHPQPLLGNNAALFQSNEICLGCHEKRNNFNGVPLCITGQEYESAKGMVNCQACHMGIVSVPKLKNGQVVPGEFVTVADHRMDGGHSQRMVARGVALEMKTEISEKVVKATVTLRNRLPHSYPTGAPFRNLFLKIAAYDAKGTEQWKNYQVHPIKDDPHAAFWYALGDAEGKPTSPPQATQVLSDTRLKPNEVRVLTYEVPKNPQTAIIRAELFYDLLLPPIKAKVKGKVPDELLHSQLAAAAEVRL